MIEKYLATRTTGARTAAAMASAFILLAGGVVRQTCADSFTESIKDAVKCDSSGTCTVVRTGSFKVSTLSFQSDGLTPDQFDASSVFKVMVGTNVVFDGGLGDDPNYQSGVSRGAKFVRSHVDAVSGKTIIDAKIALSGSATGVKISASGKISAFQPPLLAEKYAGEMGAVSDPLPAGTVAVQLGGFTDSNSDDQLVGAAAVKQVTKNGQMFDLDSVKIKAVPLP